MKKINVTMRFKKPPFWILLKLAFKEYDPNGSVAVAFGKVVYANDDFDDSFKVHEETHLIQQGRSYFGAIVWWVKYIFSIKFRFKQELEAFSRQYSWIKIYRPKQKSEWLYRCATGLSSPLYGSVVSYREAWEMIEKEAIKNPYDNKEA